MFILQEEYMMSQETENTMNENMQEKICPTERYGMVIYPHRRYRSVQSISSFLECFTSLRKTCQDSLEIQFLPTFLRGPIRNSIKTIPST